MFVWFSWLGKLHKIYLGLDVPNCGLFGTIIYYSFESILVFHELLSKYLSG